ncbi:gephyrin-like molybdotransferase Glp [Bosea sp. AS-1]|uniref:molybdopterin molybdotransferase MoeA n=1 Tax=Bosea sp. AS-1 TaxID=2015316 RepID=UPI000B77CF28|nr:gephyrin-like molybdotransferase Glp [Bosea sp. AS-1]
MASLAAESDTACYAGSPGKVIPVDIAAGKALAIARPVRETLRVPLLAAAGRVLAVPVDAPINLPPFDNAAMDGYAIRVATFGGEGPWSLAVNCRIAAGECGGPMPSRRNEAIRIFTGAPVPAGFDAVVMQEHVERSGVEIIVDHRPRVGENIRWAGEDMRSGDRLLEPGVLLSAHKLPLLAGVGFAEVEIVRKVRIGMISTGSELRNPGEELGEGQIYNSNRFMILSLLAARAWAEVVDFGIVPDRPEALSETISKAARACDALVTTGGVSAGEEDHIVAVLDGLGANLDVLKVAMRPGKPLKIGTIGSMFFAGLPGNPNAALVTFRQIALPAIHAIAGLRETGPDWQPAVAGFTCAKKLGRTEFVPVRICGRDETGRPVLEMLGRGSSASLSTMAAAEGIALLPPEIGMIERGSVLRFERFCDC